MLALILLASILISRNIISTEIQSEYFCFLSTGEGHSVFVVDYGGSASQERIDLRMISRSKNDRIELRLFPMVEKDAVFGEFLNSFIDGNLTVLDQINRANIDQWNVSITFIVSERSIR